MYFSSIYTVEIEQVDASWLTLYLMNIDLWFSDVFRGIKREHWEVKG